MKLKEIETSFVTDKKPVGALKSAANWVSTWSAEGRSDFV